MKTNRVVDFSVCAAALFLLPPVLALAALFLKMQVRGKFLSDLIVSKSYSWFEHVNSPKMYSENAHSVR